MSFDPCEDCGGLEQSWAPVLVVAGLLSISLVIAVLRRQMSLSEAALSVLRPIQWGALSIGLVVAFFTLGNRW